MTPALSSETTLLRALDASTQLETTLECGNCGADLKQVSTDAELVARSTRMMIRTLKSAQRTAYDNMFTRSGGTPPEMLCAGCFCPIMSEVNMQANARITNPNGISQPVGDVDTGVEN